MLEAESTVEPEPVAGARGPRVAGRRASDNLAQAARILARVAEKGGFLDGGDLDTLLGVAVVGLPQLVSSLASSFPLLVADDDEGRGVLVSVMRKILCMDITWFQLAALSSPQRKLLLREVHECKAQSCFAVHSRSCF